MRKSSLMLSVLLLFLAAGCYGGERDANVILRGESSSWRGNLEVVFSAEQDMYHIGGNLKYLLDSTPKEVNYYIAQPNGEGSGTSRGETIRIPKGGGSLHSSYDDIEAFAEEVTLRVKWIGETGEPFYETIPLN